MADLDLLSGKLDEIAGKVGESGEKKKEPEGKWAAFSAIGTFLLYFFGYLTLRFHLTAFGVSTDLAVLDERYLFAGAQFLVYLVASIPVLILISLPVAGLFYLLGRLWRPGPAAILWMAVIFSVVWIQGAVRQCFFFSNLLLRESLPEPWWMAHWLLLDREGGMQQIYFSLTLGAALGTLGLWRLATRRVSPWSFGSVLVAALTAVQLLFLPVTYGVLIGSKEVPRVTSLDGKEPLPAGQSAWRIWEGKEGVVFLTVKGPARTLTTVDKKEIKRTEITGYDRILNVLFEGKP